MGQTVVEKIAERHITSGPGRPLRAGDFVSLRPEHVMTHDNTSPVIAKFRSLGAARVKDASQPVFILDHDIQNRDETNLKKYAAIEDFAREQGIDFYAAGTGIGHQIMCEQLYVTPGALVVASDSHSNTYGALGAVGTPVVRTDAAALWATGEFWWQIPRSVQVVLEGELPAGTSGKDVIIALCGLYRRGEVLNAALEFCGPGVASLDIEERLAISNMTTEWGALVGWFPVDETTLSFIEQRRKRGVERVSASDVERWRREPPVPDADAAYAACITLDLSTITPQIAGPDSPQVTTPLVEIEKRRIAIHKAYLVSCVNSRLTDLRAAAEVLEGKKVADSVKLYVAAASREVQVDAEQSGVWQTLVKAGAEVLPPGCGPCIGLGTGLLAAGEVGISATNRNFKGRMGSRDATCYLASPAVVAASAAAGVICGPQPAASREIVSSLNSMEAVATGEEAVDILDGFPATLEGRWVFVQEDNLNTDGIYGKDYTYRDDMTPEMMARVVMENYDPEFAQLTAAGDILVGAYNFGTGSSREQAATALIAKGIRVVIAGSFSQTYLRNAFNNGFACVTCPALVDTLKARCAGGPKTVVGEAITVDFVSSTIDCVGETFRFSPLGAAVQSLVIAGGIENQVQKKLSNVGGRMETRDE
jgi:homoaconitate hydratase